MPRTGWCSLRSHITLIGLTQSPTRLRRDGLFTCLLRQVNLPRIQLKKPSTLRVGGFVPRTGFEPAHLAAPPPEDGASTNFATWAGQQNYADLIDDIKQIQKYLAMR